MAVTHRQLHAARTLLGMDQADVASGASVSRAVVGRIEMGKVKPKQETLDKLIGFYEAAGIEFTDGNGVRERQAYVLTYRGKEGFATFRNDVLKAAQKTDADICISNLDERLFDKWGEGIVNDSYRNRMAEIRAVRPDLKFRSLARENDTHFSARRHSEYRWIPAEEFGEFPFYIYGDKTAMILFSEDQIEIFIINHPVVTGFFRQKFEHDWNRAKLPPKNVK